MSNDPLPFGHGIPNYGSKGPERLEATLRNSPVDAAREAFRVELKNRFLTGGVDGSHAAESALVGSPSDSIRGALQAWSAPAPDPEFRSKMRAQFLEPAESVMDRAQEALGSVETAQKPAPESSVPTSNVVSEEPIRQVAARGSVKKSPGTLLRFWAPMAVAAALLVVFLGPKFGGQEEPTSVPNAFAWSLPEFPADLKWTIDGEEVTSSLSAQQISERLETAKSVAALNGGGLRLIFGRLFQVEVAQGSTLDLSNFSVANSNTKLQLGMLGDAGGFYFQTGPDFKANQYELSFKTPDAEVAVVGTVFAVDRFPAGMGMEGTCVCCADGSASVHDNGAQEAVTTQGKSCFVPPGDKMFMEGEVVPAHLAPMDDLVGASLPANWVD
ncbi:MAG: hypothetical protein ACI9X4_002457 [Glaciecola sp.]|jgi:hypothetical protein